MFMIYTNKFKFLTIEESKTYIKNAANSYVFSSREKRDSFFFDFVNSSSRVIKLSVNTNEKNPFSNSVDINAIFFVYKEVLEHIKENVVGEEDYLTSALFLKNQVLTYFTFLNYDYWNHTKEELAIDLFFIKEFYESKECFKRIIENILFLPVYPGFLNLFYNWMATKEISFEPYDIKGILPIHEDLDFKDSDPELKNKILEALEATDDSDLIKLFSNRYSEKDVFDIIELNRSKPDLPFLNFLFDDQENVNTVRLLTEVL